MRSTLSAVSRQLSVRNRTWMVHHYYELVINYEKFSQNPSLAGIPAGEALLTPPLTFSMTDWVG